MPYKDKSRTREYQRKYHENHVEEAMLRKRKSRENLLDEVTIPVTNQLKNVTSLVTNPFIDEEVTYEEY